LIISKVNVKSKLRFEIQLLERDVCLNQVFILHEFSQLEQR